MKQKVANTQALAARVRRLRRAGTLPGGPADLSAQSRKLLRTLGRGRARQLEPLLAVCKQLGLELTPIQPAPKRSASPLVQPPLVQVVPPMSPQLFVEVKPPAQPQVQFQPQPLPLPLPLPAVKVDAAPVAATAYNPPGLPLIMVVDDSLTVRRVAERLLKRAGYQVVLATDGVDALRQLQNVRPSLLLVDIEMPLMDGFTLTRTLRGQPRYQDLPIIIVTSRTGDEDRNKSFDLGADDFVTKPFQDEALLRRLAGLLQRQSAQSLAVPA